jgi:hypothetical protein
MLIVWSNVGRFSPPYHRPKRPIKKNRHYQSVATILNKWDSFSLINVFILAQKYNIFAIITN